MTSNKNLAWLIVPLMMLLLAGCGSNRDSDGGIAAEAGLGTDPATGIAYVGATTCVSCHEGFSWSAAEVAAFLEGPHVIHSSHITAADAAEGCLVCHDPIGDGPGLEGLIDPANVPADGLAAVGCENCHGAGGQHFGVGPIPNPSPDFTTCGECHATLPGSHLTFHPEGNDIISQYKASPHAESGDRNRAICVKCHTDEGARLYRDVDTAESLVAALPVAGEASPIQCRTCHDPHNPNELLEDESTNRAGDLTRTAEYNTCTNCHQDHDAEVSTDPLDWAADTTTDDGENIDLIYHGKRLSRIITDTHYDDPATPALVEGYVMDPTDERVCRNCHNVHLADNTINEQWAVSGHAGHLLEAKEAEEAVVDGEGKRRTLEEIARVKATGIAAEAFTHDSGTNGWDNTVEDVDCQRCHTATGGMNFLKDPVAYEAAVAAFELSGDPADAPNDYSHLEDWTAATGSGQTELIFCWTCHSDNSGGFNDPGTIPFPSGAVLSLDDGSNICMACHQGRESGVTVAEETPTGAETGLSFTNRHYFAAAAIMFGSEATAGYEYAGKTYEGTTGWPTGMVEPGLNTCRGCHLREGEANHTFHPDLARCQQCHPNATSFEEIGIDVKEADFDGDGLVEGFQGEIDTLEAALLDQIQFYATNTITVDIGYLPGVYAYFFDDINGDGVIDPATETGFANWYRDFDAKLLRAAYNYHSAQDPCSDIHNHKYVIQTIVDSIEDLGGDISAFTRP